MFNFFYPFTILEKQMANLLQNDEQQTTLLNTLLQQGNDQNAVLAEIATAVASGNTGDTSALEAAITKLQGSVDAVAGAIGIDGTGEATLPVGTPIE